MADLLLEKLCRNFGDFAAVIDVDLSVEPGELISLLGPSGCGKTTTLRLIAGFLEPTSGTISATGRVLSTPQRTVPPERRGMSMIFQSYAIWPNMTVEQNVAFGLELRSGSAKENKRKVQEMLATVRLEKLAERYPSELSGGQQQRVALARAIVIEPAILLMDEPLSNLDAKLRDEMRDEIRLLQERFGITTVYVTHDQNEAMAISDRIVVMNEGRIVQVDTPITLYNRPKTRFVAEFFGRTNILARTDGSDGAFGFKGIDLARLPGAGTNAVFSVRPEAVRIGPDRPSRDGVAIQQGRITRRVYGGSEWQYTIALTEGPEMLVRTSQAQTYDTNSTVWLEIDPAAFVSLGQ